jgi:hypothetical protein
MFVCDFVCGVVVVDAVLGVVVEGGGGEAALFGTEAVRIETHQVHLVLHLLWADKCIE